MSGGDECYRGKKIIINQVKEMGKYREWGSVILYRLSGKALLMSQHGGRERRAGSERRNLTGI